MKRFGVWTLIVLIAIMDVGYVRSGLAQYGLEFGVPISGASGRSVRENVYFVQWDWTAPATGPVTFDTDGSDFDVRLKIFDAIGRPVADNFDDTDGSRLDEVRFDAQQGQAYSISAREDIPDDGRFDPGTIVLNWRPASSGGSNGGGNRASADDFASATAISGASGQREANSVGADKESGEPDHAGDDGGASTWWTWTAPTTGIVTFDTRGSDFDTLLAVYTGSSVSRLTEVAANDDSGGNSWSGVRFRAQQGRTYHIAVDGWGGESGAIVLNWQSSSPGDSNGGGNRASDDDFASATALSGASGRREGSNVGAGIESSEPRHSGDDGGASVWWTWTAPATGMVTFDTHGSDFDTLLAVYTGASLKRLVEVGSNDDASKETYQSAVRFSARRGQAYHVAVDGYGGSTGAIVLNWQSASGSGADAFRSSGALTGASGRRNDSNVGAGIESGEPNHAGNSGGASVWWTWTAPATGEVTFDTSGSTFDTLLAVYTGSRLNRLTAVASNDDASSGGRQSAVSFRAQQGRTYHVVVDGYGGATGAVVLNWRAASAGSGPTNPLREQVFDNPGPGKPNYVIAGDNAGLQYWFTPGGDVSQSLYEKADGTERVRTFYDTATGAPRTVLDEISGHWMSIRAMGPDRVDFWTYNDAGSYLGGFALYAKSGRYYTGEITGVPAHEGNPITGQLTPAGASWTGSFTLTGDAEDGLTNIRVAQPELVTMIDGLSASGPVVSGVASDDQIYGLSAGRPIVTVASAESGVSLQKAMTVVGSVVAAAGLLGAGAPIFAAGAAVFVAAQVLPDIANGIRRTFGRDCPASDWDFGQTCEDLTNMAAGHLSRQGTGLLGYVRDAMDWVGEAPSWLQDRVANGRQNLAKIADGLLSRDDVGVIDDSEPASLVGPPTVGGNLSGTMTGPGGTATQLRGRITAFHNFNASGRHAQGGVTISGSVNTNGAVTSGSFSIGSTTGTVRPPGTPPPIVHPPNAKDIPDQRGTVGQTLTLNLSSYFTHPDGIALTYALSCHLGNQTDPPTLEVRQDQALITPKSPGYTICRASAHPKGGIIGASKSFTLTASAQPDPMTPGNPGDGVSHNGKFISGTGTTHTGPAGLVATGHKITWIIPRPGLSGLKIGTWNENRNSNDQLHGQQIWIHQSGAVELREYDNGTITAVAEWDSDGTPRHIWGDYTNGQKDGVRYFLHSSGSWEFKTWKDGKLHGPSGEYGQDGKPRLEFGSYVNDERSGVWVFIFSTGKWGFSNWVNGRKQGPSGSYNSAGRKDGCFTNWNNGESEVGTYYSDGTAKWDCNG